MTKIRPNVQKDKYEVTEKAKYKVINWKEYNKSLIKRGSLEIWIEEKALKKWLYTRSVMK